MTEPQPDPPPPASRVVTPMRVVLVVVAVVALVVAVVAVREARDSRGASGSRPSSVATAPPGTTPSGTTEAPVGVPSLDAVRLRVTKVADVGEAPTAMMPRPGSTSLYLTEQGGLVRRIDVSGAGATAYRVADEPVLDLTDATEANGERGLLGLAFSADGGRLYVYYTAKDDGRVTVDEYAMAGDRADPATRRNLISLEHPRFNHNGGQLQLGPDGFLYIGTGDGGGSGDPNENGQNPQTLLGKLLRIDPTQRTGTKPYAIPSDNPYASGGDGAPEVWAYGLRNPWRFSFDRETGDLWIGDVGQNLYEEIDFLPDTSEGAGRTANLGWNRMEGSHPYEGGTPPPDHTPPIFDYGRDNGECSVTGGYVYRGSDPTWQGVYVFADYCQAELRVLLREADGTVVERGTGVTADGESIPSFAEDADGNLFVLAAGGGIYRIENG